MILKKAQSKLFKIFVYGTLKQGFPNFYLNNGIKQDGNFTTEKNYLFYLVGDRYVPCLFSQDNKGEPVIGELYVVNQQQLDALDQLERVNKPDGYVRTLVNIKELTTEKISDAFIYLKVMDATTRSHLKIGPINFYHAEHTELYQYRK